MGFKRDCWVLNPRITNASHPEWMKCYQFIGSVIGRYSVKIKLTLVVAFAPTFWKMLLNDEPTLEDFANEDADLQKRLDKLNTSHA